jgi:hypothetical protein
MRLQFIVIAIGVIALAGCAPFGQDSGYSR